MESRNSPITYFRRRRRGERTNDEVSRAFIRGRSLFIDVPPTEVISYAQRNGFEESVIGHLWRTVPNRTGVPIVTTSEARSRRLAFAIPGPQPSDTFRPTSPSYRSICPFNQQWFTFRAFERVTGNLWPRTLRWWIKIMDHCGILRNRSLIGTCHVERLWSDRRMEIGSKSA